MEKFNVGDKIYVKSCTTLEFVGAKGVVTDVTNTYTRVSFAKGVAPCLPYGRDNGWNFLHGEALLVTISTPTIATDLKLKPQTKSVLIHLRNNDHISPMQAQVIYGITRLAAAIYDLRKAGYIINKTMKTDAAGHHYASYALPKAN